MSLANLQLFLKQYCELTEEDWLVLKKQLSDKELKAGEEFVTPGHTCNQIGFLIQGITRVYYTVDGKEITSYFNYENRNQFVCSFTSFLKREPSQEIIQAIEDCQLLILHYNDLQELYTKSNNFQKLGRLIAEHNYLLASDRIHSLQFEQALDRYKNFIKIYPNLINRIPHHYIASYLGIAPESLSRIRKQFAKE